MDNLTTAQRKKNMTRIRSTNTKPEEIVGKYLFSRGLRYRKNVRSLPGSPDLVFPKYKTVVFVNGCFWHQHEGCKYSVMPKSNLAYWGGKLERNVQRDILVREQLEKLGWRILTVWECELKKGKKEETLEKLYSDLTIVSE